MTMARVRAPERLRYQAPGEWGLLLGLDRCPEVKTMRKKVGRPLPHPSTQWQRALAGVWLDDGGEDWMTLAVDGHVKVYSGKGKVPKHFVSRQKPCLPATASYWINALSGAPLVCLHKDLDGKMVHALEHDVVPELEVDIMGKTGEAILRAIVIGWLRCVTAGSGPASRRSRRAWKAPGVRSIFLPWSRRCIAMTFSPPSSMHARGGSQRRSTT